CHSSRPSSRCHSSRPSTRSSRHGSHNTRRRHYRRDTHGSHDSPTPGKRCPRSAWSPERQNTCALPPLSATGFRRMSGQPRHFRKSKKDRQTFSLTSTVEKKRIGVKTNLGNLDKMRRQVGTTGGFCQK